MSYFRKNQSIKFGKHLKIKTMNERDDLLLKLANLLDRTESEAAFQLAEMAFLVETREEIKRIAKSLYHKEEGRDV